MKIAYIGVPIALGADRQGVELAPDYFRKEGIIEMMNDIAGCYDLGNVLSSIIAEGKYAANPEVKYLDTLVDMTSQLRDKVASVLRQGYFPLVVGGDHSLGLGSGAGLAMQYDNPAIIWFDAHGDFNTEETSPSGNLHGMPCAALMGWCKSSMQTVPHKTIKPSNFYWIGSRDLDPDEKQMASEHNLHIYSATEVKADGMNAVMEKVVSSIHQQGIENIHLSIDIDSMDPSIVCGTGTRVKDGLRNGDFYTFLDRIFDTRKVVSTDFVEYNRLLDDVNKTTAKWCIEALHYLAIKINEL